MLSFPSRWAYEVESAARDFDDRTLRWMAETDHGPLRPLLRVSARAGDLLAPWVAVSLRLVADGTPEDRTAVVRGWTAVGVTALIHGAVIKPATQRGRPDPTRLPSEQRRKSSPSTSAFASGHSGSAAAFAVATGRSVPTLRRSMAVGTIVVAYSQIYTGRHYLSDVVTGVALGAAVGELCSRLPVGASR